MRTPHLPLVLLFCVALVGCREETLYVGLTQVEANQMLALMYASGLPAAKLLDKDGSYTVTTTRDAFPESMALLHAHGLPREQFESMGEVFQKEGFVSSALEERARFNFALSQEMARTISSIDGVVMARVHLVMPERERLSDDRQTSSASVFVKHRPDVDLSGALGKIKSIVINGVENMPYEKVTVAFFETEPLSAGGGGAPGDANGAGSALQATLASPGGPLGGFPGTARRSHSPRWRRSPWPRSARSAGYCGARRSPAARPQPPGRTSRRHRPARERGRPPASPRRDGPAPGGVAGRSGRRGAGSPGLDALGWREIEALPVWCALDERTLHELVPLAGAVSLLPAIRACVHGDTLRHLAARVGGARLAALRTRPYRVGSPPSSAPPPLAALEALDEQLETRGVRALLATLDDPALAVLALAALRPPRSPAPSSDVRGSGGTIGAGGLGSTDDTDAPGVAERDGDTIDDAVPLIALALQREGAAAGGRAA